MSSCPKHQERWGFGQIRAAARNASIFISFALATSSYGRLVWQDSEQHFEASFRDRFITTHYRFVNRGKETVRIVSITTSCDCTTANLSSREFAPGESGQLEVRFDFEGRLGHQEKSIDVITSENRKHSTRLRLTVDISAPFKAEPEVLFWKIGEKPKTKTIFLRFAESETARIGSVATDNPNFTVQVKAIDGSKDYQLLITPKSTEAPGSATVVIRTDYPPDNPLEEDVYARIVKRSPR
jgi:hypothetical protein